MTSKKEPSWMREDWPALAKPPLNKLSEAVKRRLFDAARQRRFAVHAAATVLSWHQTITVQSSKYRQHLLCLVKDYLRKCFYLQLIGLDTSGREDAVFSLEWILSSMLRLEQKDLTTLRICSNTYADVQMKFQSTAEMMELKRTVDRWLQYSGSKNSEQLRSSEFERYAAIPKFNQDARAWQASNSPSVSSNRTQKTIHKSDIGAPQNFEHKVHVGPNSQINPVYGEGLLGGELAGVAREIRSETGGKVAHRHSTLPSRHTPRPTSANMAPIRPAPPSVGALQGRNVSQMLQTWPTQASTNEAKPQPKPRKNLAQVKMEPIVPTTGYAVPVINDETKQATALFDFVPKSVDELACNLGDGLLVKAELNETWLHAFNTRTAQNGTIPKAYISFTNRAAVKSPPPKPKPKPVQVRKEDEGANNSLSFVGRTVRALYDYRSNYKEDLCFEAGDRILVIADKGPHWLMGRLLIMIENRGVPPTGIFPKNYVELEAFAWK